MYEFELFGHVLLFIVSVIGFCLSVCVSGFLYSECMYCDILDDTQ